MTPFERVTGIAAPLMRANVDTDQITPGHTGMKVQKSGFAAGLFYNWRYAADGSEDPDFILNQLPFRHASFLIAGDNFGCGSSREFAVWALRDFGIRAIVAPSFGAIFTSNCFMNGVAPIALGAEAVAAIAAQITPDRAEMTIDMRDQLVLAPDGAAHRFSLPALQRERLLEGLDAIDATLRRSALITAHQARDAARRPWVYAIPASGES